MGNSIGNKVRIMISIFAGLTVCVVGVIVGISMMDGAKNASSMSEDSISSALEESVDNSPLVEESLESSKQDNSSSISEENVESFEKESSLSSSEESLESVEEESHSDSSSSHTHDFSLKMHAPDYLCVSATCEEKAQYYYSCACGELSTETFSFGDPLGHDEEAHEEKLPTCKESGWAAYVTCRREECRYSTFEALPVIDTHSWDEGSVTTPPTCEEEGVKTFLCTVCGEQHFEGLDKSAHAYASVWAKTETHHWRVCACGDKTDFAEHTDVEGVCVVCGQMMGTDGVLYEVTDGRAKVIGYNGLGTQARIASVYEGVPVTEIAENAFAGCLNITKIIIPDTVTEIGASAFYNCEGLEEVSIGKGVLSIGDRTFQNCKKLEKIVIPDNVTFIGSGVFQYCSSLAEITIGKGVCRIGKDIVYQCSQLTTILFQDAVGWYKTRSEMAWMEGSDGDEVDVSDCLDNVEIFKRDSKKYWYKQ